MNARRVLLGGIAATVVLLAGRKALATFLIGDEMILLYGEHPATPGEIGVALTSGLAQGIAIAWLYAAVRPRLGPGPKTALLVGAAAWILSSPHYLLVLGHLRMAEHMDHFPWHKYALYVAPASFVGTCLAALMGGACYREKVAA